MGRSESWQTGRIVELYNEGLSLQQIGERVGKTKRAVAQVVYRIRQRQPERLTRKPTREYPESLRHKDVIPQDQYNHLRLAAEDRDLTVPDLCRIILRAVAKEDLFKAVLDD